MTKIQFAVFGKENLNCLDCLPELRQLFERVLNKKQQQPFAVIVELPYRRNAWECRKPAFKWPDDPQLSNFVAGPSPIVGLVTDRVMEVYLSEKGRGRKTTTTVLCPGMFFGLFEAYADLSGDWTIASGLVSFMICPALGNKDKWRRGGVKNVSAKHSKFGMNSPLSFEWLISDDACSSWISQSVWLKPNLINDRNLRIEIEHFLQQATIKQLTSVIRQNPTWGRVDEADTPDPELLFIQYLDSVIGGDTPIFQLAEQNDDLYLPVAQVKEQLALYRDKKRNHWDILIPKKLEKGARGIHPVNYVSRFPSGAESLITRDAQTIETVAKKHGRQAKKVDANGFCSVNYASDTGEAKVSVIICNPPPKKSNEESETEKRVKALEDRLRALGEEPPEFSAPAPKPDAPAPHPIKQLADAEREYTWPPHLNTVVIIEKLK